MDNAVLCVKQRMNLLKQDVRKQDIRKQDSGPGRGDGYYDSAIRAGRN